MKPLGHNNLSAWGYIGLFILFSLPYIGTPALLICAIFVKDSSVKNFARALLILAVIGWMIILVIGFSGIIQVEDFNFPVNGGVEAFLSSVKNF